MDFAGNRRNPLKSALRGPEVSEFLNLAAFLNKIHYALATQNRNQISENIIAMVFNLSMGSMYVVFCMEFG